MRNEKKTLTTGSILLHNDESGATVAVNIQRQSRKLKPAIGRRGV
jgi:hypothetical protein